MIVHAEYFVGGGAEREECQNADGESESKTEKTATIGVPLLGLKMKNETNNKTKESTTTLGISLLGIDAGCILNIHTEIFIPIVVETSKPNK